ncbi:MAG: DUF3488 domain-containing protein [Halobacteriota archaeon]
MRERYEQNQGYSRLGSPQPRSAQHSHTVERTRSRELGKKVSVGILLTTLTLLLITVGFAGYWNGGIGLIDHDTSTNIALAKNVQQTSVLSPNNPNAAPSDVWYNINPPGLPIVFSAVATLGGVNISMNSELLVLLQGFSAFILVAFVLTTFVVVKKITGDTRIAALASFFSATFSSNPAILGPQYIVASSFGLILMMLGTYYLYAAIKDDAGKPILTSKYTFLGALTVTTLIFMHRLSTTTFYYIFTIFIVLYVLINLGTRMHLKQISAMVLLPVIISAPWWLSMYLNYKTLPWSIPQILTLSAGMLGLAAVGLLFSGRTDQRSPQKRRDRLFAVIGHTTKDVLNLIIILVLVAMAGVIAVSLVFSAQTAFSLAFMVSSLGLIPILSILVYKTTLWDRAETNPRNMLVSSWLLVALVPALIGVLGVAVPHMPYLIQRVIPHVLLNQGGVQSILYLVFPLSILASLLVFRLAYEPQPRVHGLRRRRDNRAMRTMLIIAFVVISVLSPVFHIAAASALAVNAQEPKLTADETSALQWLNQHTTSKDTVLSDPTFLQYISTFTNARAAISTDSENSYVVTHQLSQLTDLSNFMNSSTDSATKLLIAKKMGVDYFVYDPIKANYSSSLWGFPLANFVPDPAIMTVAHQFNGVTIYQINQSQLAQTSSQYASISNVDVHGDSVVVYITNYASDPMSLHIAWQDQYKPVTLNAGETKAVPIDFTTSGSSSPLNFVPTLGSTSTLYVSLWMDSPSNSSNGTLDARYTYPIDAVSINSQQLV